jgi:hypothetical protein
MVERFDQKLEEAFPAFLANRKGLRVGRRPQSDLDAFLSFENEGRRDRSDARGINSPRLASWRERWDFFRSLCSSGRRLRRRRYCEFDA